IDLTIAPREGFMKIRYAALCVLLLTGCGDDDSTGTLPTMTVHAGQSIQAAVNAAAANTTIFVEPGVYHESAGAATPVTISKDGIKLIGQSTAEHPVVLESAAGQQNGIVVAPSDSVTVSSTEEHPGEHPACGENGHMLHNFTLQGFTVRGFDQFGVYLACVNGFSLSHNSTDADKLYGLFPVRSHTATMD